MARLGLRALKKPNMTGFFDSEKPVSDETSNLEITSNYDDPMIDKLPETSNPSSNPITSNPKIMSNLDSNQKLVTQELPVKSSKYISNQQVTGFQSPIHFLTLTGLQKKVVQTLFKLVVNKDDLSTESISIEQLNSLLGRSKNHSDIEVLKKTIIKLQHKGFVKKKSFVNGRGGNTSYFIPASIYLQIVQAESLESSNSVVTKPVTTQVTEGYSKKERNILNNDTFILSDTLKRIGLTQNHLLKSNRSPEDIQQILFHFSFSIENNEIKASYKLPVLLSVLSDPTKTWVSESYLNSINQEIEANELRLKHMEDLASRRKALETLQKFREYLDKHPEFLMSVKSEQKFQVSDEIIQSIAFEKFKDIET